MPAATIRKIRALTATACSAVAVAAALATWHLVATPATGAGTMLVGISIAGLIVVSITAWWLTERSVRGELERRAEVEAAVRRSEAQFSGILNVAADAIITVDERRAVVHFNRGAEEIFGYGAAEVIGKPLALLLPERLADAHEGHMSRFAASGETARRMGERRDVLGRRQNGEEFPAEASISKLVTPAGTLFTAVLRDITERLRLERHEHHLSIAGLQLGATLDVDALLAVIVELPVPEVGEWCILDVALGGDGGDFRRVVSHDAHAGRAAALEALARRELHWDAPSEVIDVFRNRKSRHLPTVSVDWLEAHAADDDEFDALRALDIRSLLFVPLTIGDRVLAVMTIGRSGAPGIDAAGVRLAEALAERSAMAMENAALYQRAQRATAARDDVLAVVAHDLRNPTSAIAMCARTLLEHPPESIEEQRSLEGTILDSARWMHRLMQDLLDVASIDAGRLAVDVAPQPLQPMFDAALDMVAEQGRAASVTFVAAPGTGLPDVVADHDRIVQVLGNLLGNAIRFSNAGGRITLEASRGDREVVIVVRDTGIGIAPTDLPHIFDRFWHAHRDRLTRGSGLGLAIARGIIAAHGGRIWATSELGRGSSFSFSLPAVDQRPLSAGA